MYDLGFRVQGPEFSCKGLGFKGQGVALRVQNLGLGLRIEESKVQG